MELPITIVAAAGERRYYTPWFPRMADYALFAYEVVFSDMTNPLEVEMLTKNVEDSGSGGSALSDTFNQMGGTNIWQADVTDMCELVRFVVFVQGYGSAGESVSFRFLPPTWYARARTA